MGLEMVVEGANGARLRTNPSRDIAYFWPQILEESKQGLLKDNWEPWYKDYLAKNDVDEEEVLEAHACLTAALCATDIPDLDHPYKALQATGFFQCKIAAQLVVMAKVGQIGSMAFWAGIRSALPKGDLPDQMRSLIQDAEATKRSIFSSRRRKGKKPR
jgi:hypothetical protein